MENKKEFGLIGGLFPKAQLSKEKERRMEVVTSVSATKRTFKISNEFWNDFVDLAAAKKMTQAELINRLIENSVKENSELIEQYKKLLSSGS